MSLPMDHNYFNYHEKRSGGCFDGPFKKTPPAPPKPFSSVGENQPLGITPFEPRAVVAGWQIIEAAIRLIATLSDWLGYGRRFLDRKNVVSGRRESVRGDLDGGRN